MAGGVSLFYELFPAYSFHLGLFMFCSGYFYKDSAENNIGYYIKKKLKHLILPLYLWNFVYALFAQIMSLRGFTFGVGVNFDLLLIAPIRIGNQYVYNLGTWFVIPLFLVQVFSVIYRRLFSFIKSSSKEYFNIIIALFLGLCGMYMSVKGYNTGWGLLVTRCLHFIPFYFGGIFYHKILEKKDNLSNSIYFLIIIIIQLIVIIMNGKAPTYGQAGSNFDTVSLTPYIVGFCGIAFWLRITKILEPVIGKSRIVNLIADNSFSIMTNQFLGFMLVKSFFAYCFKNTSFLFQDFAWKAYHTDIFYYYLPKGIQQIKIIYVFVSIVIAILIQLIINKVMKVINLYFEKKKMFKGIYGLYAVIFMLLGSAAFMVSGYVNRAGGVEVELIDNYTLGSELYFDKNKENYKNYCISGLSASEESFTWTSGNEVIMSFTVDDVYENLYLEFQCGVYREKQTLNVYVNDNFIDTEELYEWGIHKIIIPKEYINEGKILLKFELPDASSPLEDGIGADSRVLGLSLEKMVIAKYIQ